MHDPPRKAYLKFRHMGWKRQEKWVVWRSVSGLRNRMFSVRLAPKLPYTGARADPLPGHRFALWKRRNFT
jgi:hypothetical protein